MSHTWTWDKLVKNAYRMNPKSRGINYPYTPKFEICEFTSGNNRGKNVVVPYMGTHSFLISLRAWGVTQSSLHKVTLLFHDVDIVKENPNSTDYFMCQYDGVTYWVHKLDKYRNPLTSRCSCADEFFTWALWKFNNGCLYGSKPRPYQRKTTTYPERNPKHIVGCCKHVYNAWSILRNSGMTMN